MTLFLPVGPPGCGKSQLAAQMVQRGLITESAVVSTDRLRAVMTGNPTNQAANGPAWEVARTITHTRLEHGLTVYFDATNLNPDWYDKMLAKAHATDHRVLFIYFDTPYAVCRKQNLGRKELAIPDVAVERMIAEHAAIDPQDLKKDGDLLTGGADYALLLSGIAAWIEGSAA